MNTKTKLLLLAIFPLAMSLLFTAQSEIKETLAKPNHPKIALTSSNTPSQADYRFNGIAKTSIARTDTPSFIIDMFKG